MLALFVADDEEVDTIFICFRGYVEGEDFLFISEEVNSQVVEGFNGGYLGDGDGVGDISKLYFIFLSRIMANSMRLHAVVDLQLVCENIPNQALLVFVLDVQDCLLLSKFLGEGDVTTGC